MSLPTKILICGAGIAGLTAAYWLHHYGFDVDIIEKADNFKNRYRLGYAVDFWGPGFSVAEKMQLREKLQLQHYSLKEFIFINEMGEVISRFDIPEFRKVLANRVFTLLRGDLETALLQALPSKIKIQWDVIVDRFENETNKVTAYFNHKGHKTYDVVLGSDGIHSHTRSLIFGDEKNFSHDLGYQLCAMIQPNNINIDDSLYTYSVFGKQAAVCPIKNNQLATFFIYRSEKKIIVDAKKKLIEKFKDEHWIIPNLLNNIDQASEIFSDRLSQIQMPLWYQNRVVLIGDACQCLTLMSGQGASMAMAGAYILATQLRDNNIYDAFKNYQAIMKPVIERKQTDARNFLNAFIPNEKTNRLSRNFFTRSFFKKMTQQSDVDEFCKK